MSPRPTNPMGMFTYVTLCVWFPGMGWTTMSGLTSGPRSPCPPWVAPPSVDPPGRTGLHPLQRRYVMYKALSCARSYSIFVCDLMLGIGDVGLLRTGWHVVLSLSLRKVATHV